MPARKSRLKVWCEQHPLYTFAFILILVAALAPVFMNFAVGFILIVGLLLAFILIVFYVVHHFLGGRHVIEFIETLYYVQWLRGKNPPRKFRK